VKKGKTYLSRASRAGSRVGPTSLKTYIPAQIVRHLGIENGDILKWFLRGRKISLKVIKQPQKA
jgi:hypothetical protein